MRISWAPWLGVLVIALLLGADARSTPPVVPLAAALDGNVIVLRPVLEDGRSLRVLADTGGYDSIAPAAVRRFGFAATPVVLGGKERQSVVFPPFRGSGVGAPATRWLVARPEAFASTFALELDGTLGPAWFLSHRVTIDYVRRSVELDDAVPAHAERVGLLVQVGPAPVPELPRSALALVDVRIDGAPLTMLLDTGSTAIVAPRLRDRMPDRAVVRQISFVDDGLLERWHRAHTDWPYDARGASIAAAGGAREVAVIRVPAVQIGTRSSPPVWFAARPAGEFKELSDRMKRHVSGDLSGDALRAWRVTFDFAGDALWLE